MIDEPVHVVGYSDNWPRQFDVERERIASGLGVLSKDIEHIGSTAVPGLPSKDIIDMMLGLADYPVSDSIVDRIVKLGCEDCGEGGVIGRRYFRRRDAVSFNLHAVLKNAEHWTSNIALRNYLRLSGTAKIRYATAKQRAVASGANMLMSYSEAKSSTVRELLDEALAARFDAGSA